MAEFIALLNRCLSNSMTLEEFQTDYFELWEALRDTRRFSDEQLAAGDDIYNALNDPIVDEFEVADLIRTALDVFLYAE